MSEGKYRHLLTQSLYIFLFLSLLQSLSFSLFPFFFRMGSLAMLVLLFFSQGQSSTPEVEKRSTCDQCDERLFCNCSSRNYRHVPTVTVTEVVTLDLSFNDITSVAEDDLREYTWLRTLDLHSNRIQSIHEWAFHLLQVTHRVI